MSSFGFITVGEGIFMYVWYMNNEEKKLGCFIHYDDLDSRYLFLSQLIEKRIAAGLTQEELARKVGTKQSAISRLESGNYNPTLSFLSKVANGLGVKLRFEMG